MAGNKRSGRPSDPPLSNDDVDALYGLKVFDPLPWLDKLIAAVGGEVSGASREAALVVLRDACAAARASAARSRSKLDLTTAEGNRELLSRADRLMLTGKMPGRFYQNLVKGVTARCRLIVEADLDRREHRVKDYSENIDRSRMAGRKLRDVGPPPDSVTKATAKVLALPSAPEAGT